MSVLWYEDIKNYWCFLGLHSTSTSCNYLTFTSKLLVLFKVSGIQSFCRSHHCSWDFRLSELLSLRFLYFSFFLVVIGVALSLWMWCLALFPLMDILPLYPLQHKQLLTGWQIWIYLFRLPTWMDSGFLTGLNICNFLHFHIILSKQNCASQWRHFNHLNRKLKSTRHPQVPDGLAISHRYVYWLIVLMCIKI